MNTTATAQLTSLTADQPTATLAQSFDLTASLLVPGISVDDYRAVVVMRSAISDELDHRHPDTFEAWLESDASAVEFFADVA
jgi:hypothetical protein